MSAGTPQVCWFQDCNKDSVALVGGKCSSLGELINAGVRVPPGFAITTEAYRQFIEASGALDEAHTRLDGIDPSNVAALEEASAAIRARIEQVPFTADLEDEVGEFYRKLSMQCYMAAVPVAVRSSATAEDLPGASFAGQQDTFLWIRGVDRVMEHVRKCFSSLFTGRAIGYRVKMGFAHEQVGISVGIQKMANSYTAGVMFTLNPSNGDRSTILINSSFGFGEAVVSGEVTPDEFVVSKVSYEVLRRTVTTKDVYYHVDHENHCAKRYDVPVERQNVQSLVDEQIIELARMGRIIENHYGRPMDIEWAVDKNMPDGANVFILQARPETVWAEKKTAPVSGDAKSAMDHILATMLAGKRI